MATKKNKHKWTFKARFRSEAYGWKGTKLASQRLREAISEIRKVARKDPVLAGDGAVGLLERLWPALMGIDGSSGALGNAVDKAANVLVQFVIDAPAGDEIRSKWLNRLQIAVAEDGVDYLLRVRERWGELCGSAKMASRWADELLPGVLYAWAPEREAHTYFSGTIMCLSSLLAAGRHEELLALLEKAPHVWWHDRLYGVRALIALGRKAEAFAYAEASGGHDDPDKSVARACEDILLSSGFKEEAYRRYGLINHTASTNIGTFRAIAKKYPWKDKTGILADLIAAAPGHEGRWFATAKSLELFDLAVELANRSFCDPRTLNRAAEAFRDKQPEFALECAVSAYRWLADGRGYEVTSLDALAACKCALDGAERLDRVDETLARLDELAVWDRSQDRFAAKAFVRARREWLDRREDGPSAEK